MTTSRNIYKSITHFVLSLFLWVTGIYMISSDTFAQATISIQDFEATPATPTMTYASVGGAFVTGNSGTGDRPASSPFYANGSRAWGRQNGTSTLTFGNNIGLGTCTSKFFRFNLAAWSMSSTGNGMDGADNVTVEVSLDGGTTWSTELRVLGNSNANWSYTGGTGSATVTYDGNNTPTDFQPAGGGTRAGDGYSNIRINLPDACTQARIRITLLNNSSGEQWTIDDVELFGTCVASCSPDTQPTTNATAITVSPGCTSAQINFTGGNGNRAIIVMSTTCPISTNPADQVSYSSSSTFGVGSTVGAGNYVVYNGAAGSTIVSGLTAGVSYCFKIYEYNGVAPNCQENYLTTGVTSTNFTTSTVCAAPQIRSILVNACTAVEGFDEMVIMTNGNSALDVSDLTIDFPSGGTFCNSGCGTNTIGNNASYISSLNTLAGCSLFQYADPIPAGAAIFVFTGQNPTMTFDYSSECPGGGPYYALFCNNTTDNSGRFANSASANRTLTVDFGGTSDVVTYYSSSANTGDDGDFVSFDDDGTPSFGNIANCAVVLPVEWGYFNVHTEGKEAWINWSTMSELDNEYFQVEYANENGQEFKSVGRVKSQGQASSEQHYSLHVNHLDENFYYFKIRQVDLNGEYSFSDITTAKIEGSELRATRVEQSPTSTIIEFNRAIDRNSHIRILDMTGKIVYEGDLLQTSNELEIPSRLNGLLLFSIEHPIKAPHFLKLMVNQRKM